jgi:hypothetical protein
MAVSTRDDAEQLHTWLPGEVSRALNAHASERTISRAAMARQVLTSWAAANPVPAPAPFNFTAALGPTGLADENESEKEATS